MIIVKSFHKIANDSATADRSEAQGDE
jgi:hypothetical protein